MMNNQNVLCYLDEIDNAYLKGRVKGWSRYSAEWTDFSTPMNKEIRQKIKDGVKEEPLLQMVLPYWFNRSEMLEIYYTKKHKYKKGTLKRRKKACEMIRKDISRGRVNEIGRLSMNDTVSRAVKGATK